MRLFGRSKGCFYRGSLPPNGYFLTERYASATDQKEGPYLLGYGSKDIGCGRAHTRFTNSMEDMIVCESTKCRVSLGLLELTEKT